MDGDFWRLRGIKRRVGVLAAKYISVVCQTWPLCSKRTGRFTKEAEAAVDVDDRRTSYLFCYDQTSKAG